MPKDVNVVACLTVSHSVPSVFMQHWTRFILKNTQMFGRFSAVISDLIYVGKSRNLSVEKAFSLDFKPDYIFMVDADNLVQPDVIGRLMHCDKDIISALYFAHSPPYEPLMYNINENGYFESEPHIKPNRPQKVEGIGMGCALIKSEVFKNISYPWFKYWLNDPRMDMISRLIKDNPEFEKKVCRKLGLDKLEDMPEMRDIGQIGEDLYFCVKAKQAGYDIFVDTATVVPHWGAAITEKEFKPYEQSLDKKQNRDRVNIRLDMDQMEDPVIREMANIMNKHPDLKEELYSRVSGDENNVPISKKRINELEKESKKHTVKVKNSGSKQGENKAHNNSA